MCTTFLTNQHGITLGVVACILSSWCDSHQATVGILPLHGGDPFGNDLAARILANMNHLGAGIGLLVVTGQRN